MSAKTPGAPRAHRLHPSLAALGMALAILAAWSNSFQGPFVFDDTVSIRANSQLESVWTALQPAEAGGLTTSGRPLLALSLALNHAVGGWDVVGYHVTNLAIHALAALALFGLVRRTLADRTSDAKDGRLPILTAAAIATVWALHPLQTESVTYIVQRAESLVGLFYLTTLYTFARAVSPDETRRKLWLVLSVTACALGMASKEVMVSAPIIVLLYDQAFVAGSFAAAWRERRAYYLGIAATWLVLAACVLSTGGRGGTVAIDGIIPWWRYALTQCYAIVHYLRLAAWPSPLVLDYGSPVAASLGEVLPKALVLLALVAATLVALWKAPKIGWLGATFFAVLAPSSSVIPVITQTIAEHRMYLALAPLIAVVILAVRRVAGPRSVWLWLGIAAVLGVATFVRNRDYRSTESIWQDVIAKEPANPRAWAALGAHYERLGQVEPTLDARARAFNLQPDSVEARVRYANALAWAGRKNEALDLYRKAIARMPVTKKGRVRLNWNYGAALVAADQYVEAIVPLEAALREDPEHPECNYLLGLAYANTRQPDRALPCFEAALKLGIPPAPIHVRMATALRDMGRKKEALEHFSAAVILAPDDARAAYFYANLLLQEGLPKDAVTQYRNALAREPDLAEARNELGIAYAQLGRFDEARQSFEAALRIRPDFADARANLKRLDDDTP